MTELIAGAVASAREYLRAGEGAEEGVLVGAARAAIGVAEAFLGAVLPTTWEAVPGPVAQGLVMLVAHLAGPLDSNAVPPAAVAALWRPFRVVSLIGAAA